MKKSPLDELARRAPDEGASLSELQNWMVEVLRQERGLESSAAMRAAASIHFSGNDRLSPAAQINLYRQQFWLRHTSILIEDFPGLTGLLGQERWEKLSQAYLTERGYDITSLRDLGKLMPEQLLRQPFSDQELLVDMARLEWAYVEAFDAENDSPLDPAHLAKIPADAWQDARFILSPSISLLTLRYPVADIRRKLKKSPEDAHRLANELEPEEQFLVVYRRDRELFDKKLSRAAFLLLQEFQAGLPLVRACESVVNSYPEAEAVFNEQLFSWFSLWGRLGWIIRVEISAPSS